MDILELAYQIPADYNPGAINPYHGTLHSQLMVALANAYECENEKVNNDLLIACACHDLGHSGKSDALSNNIQVAIKMAKPFVEIINNMGMSCDYNTVSQIIAATEYPYVFPNESLHPTQALIRDFDLMMVQFLDVDFLNHLDNTIQLNNYIPLDTLQTRVLAMFVGLYKEMTPPSKVSNKNNLLEFIKKCEEFQSNVQFNTDYAKNIAAKYNRSDAIKLLVNHLNWISDDGKRIWAHG